uniref:SKP1-like protein n=1 Tax=Leersia perrieri TaxID=77586 RepID=A0A0D9WHI5_9ORYZ
MASEKEEVVVDEAAEAERKGKGVAVDDTGASGVMIDVVSMDGMTIEMPVAAAKLSKLFSDTVESNPGGKDLVKLPPQVSVDTFRNYVLVYCNKHAKVDAKGNSIVSDQGESLKDWDMAFININVKPLYNLMGAANLLGIDELHDLACYKVANMLKGKNTEEMREILNIRSDFTPAEEQQIKDENPWAFGR